MRRNEFDGNPALTMADGGEERQLGTRVLARQRPQIRYPDPLREGVRVLSGADDGDSVQIQIPERRVHGAGDPGRGRVLELECRLLRALRDQQVQLGVAVRGPEEAFTGVGLMHLNHLLQCESLPRRAELRMGEQAGMIRKIEQRVQDAAVAEQDLR